MQKTQKIQTHVSRLEEHRAGTRVTSRYTAHEYEVQRDGSYRRTNKPLSKRACRRLAAQARKAAG